MPIQINPRQILCSALLVLSSLSLVACAGQVPLNAARPASSLQSFSRVPAGLQPVSGRLRQDPTAILPLLKELYGKELADSLQQGKPTPAIDQLLQQQGPAAFALLGQDAQLRSQLYPYSDQMVIREYNKPSPADNVPPVSPAELQGLLARLQPGDVILCGNDQSFVHGILYLGQGQIVHSLATQPDMPDKFRGVVQESLATYVARSERDTFVVLRPKGQTPASLAPALNYARQQVGKGYDSLFLNASDEKLYCTELVWKAFGKVARGPRVLPHQVQYGWEMVTVEDFMDSPDFDTVWTRNRQRPPVGQLHKY